MKRAFLSALLISSALPAYAADIVVTPIGGGDQMITIEGQIGPDDFDTFQRKASGLTGRVAVHLRGPGGNLISALRIGEFIRFKAWATAVGSECDSACAAIWLAGVPRLMFPTARIGSTAGLTGVCLLFCFIYAWSFFFGCLVVTYLSPSTN